MSIPTTIPVALLSDPKALYDFFMRHLEPELLRENLEHLDEPYPEESAEDRAKRYARYNDACHAMNQILDVLNDELAVRGREIIRSLAAAANAQDTAERDQALNDLSHAIDHA